MVCARRRGATPHMHAHLPTTCAVCKPHALLTCQVRKAILGDEARSFRHALQDELRKPVRVKLRDKIAFTLGVVNMLLTQAVALLYPSHFKWWYSLWVLPLLVWRYYAYRRRKFQFFLADFCYFANALCMAHLFVAPESPFLFEAAFMLANGPLVWAVMAWRNSLVFHSLDKITSLFIHIMPPLLMFCQRWYYPAALAGRPLEIPAYLNCVARGDAPTRAQAKSLVAHYTTCDASFLRALAVPLAAYGIWQAVYFWFTEVHSKRRLDADPGLQTSLRWLTRSRSGALYRITVSVCRLLGVLGRSEVFDPVTLKTKAVFMVTQLVYTVLTLAPTPLLYDYKWLHAAFLLCIGLNAVWNGSAYYIEVFSVKYMQGIEKAIAEYSTRRDAELKAAAEAASTAAVEVSAAHSAARCVCPLAPPYVPCGVL